MRQVILRIPLDGPWNLGPLGELPGFGFGVVLFVWAALGVVWIYRHRTELAMNGETFVPVLIWLTIATVIFMLPKWTHRGSEQILAEASSALKNLPRKDPRYQTAYDARDQAWRTLRAFDEAATTYQKEIEEHPQRPEAHRRLAWILSTAPDESVRDGVAALKHAQQACELTLFRDPVSLDALAAAHAENGNFEAALRWSREAASLAAKRPSHEIADAGEVSRIRQRMQMYQRETPYRDEGVGVHMPVYGYGLMLFLGFLVAGWAAIRRGRWVGIDKEAIWDLGLWVLIAGIGGARLFYVVQYHDRVFEGKSSIGEYLFALVNLREGGLVLYGGVIVALTVFLLMCARKKLSPLLMADVIMPSFFIGLAFGRMGCFMNGCCYGDRCELPWAVTFPLGSVPDMALVHRGFVGASQALTLPLHPSQIYSSLNALILATVAHFYFKFRHRDGSVLGFALLVYPITRFLIEYLRGDEMGKFSTELTISQWVSLGMLATGIAFVTWLSKRPAKLTPVMISPPPTAAPA
ncbi:MAG: hypothetical protein Tsb009_09990 [Planctomycetaceae bacterium]